MRLTTLIATCLIAVATSLPGMAQEGLFGPRVMVNDRAITNYEYDQRYAFLTLLRAPGDLEKLAETQLIEDRLRMIAAERAGIKATPEQIKAGMEEFAARANLSAEQFIAAIGRDGVQPQTFRDFVEAGIVWREVVRARFVGRVTISDADVDRAIATRGQRGSVRLLLSEIILPAPPGREGAALDQARRIKAETEGEAAFARAARTYSASPSRGRGGRLDWLPLANLPPAIAPVVLGLAPGEVSDPIQIPNGVILFQLRAIEEIDAPEPKAMTLEYAQFFLPNDARAADEVARIRARVDGCNDLYGIAKGLPEDRLVVETRPLSEVPQDIALELARLDAGESSDALVRGGNRVFLMLCKRSVELEEAPSRDDIRNQLLNQRLAALADGYLEELRSDAIIRRP